MAEMQRSAGPSRRTVVTAAAWAVPVVAVAAAAPMAAASPVAASFSQIAVDNAPHNRWGYIRVAGRGVDGDEVVDAPLPMGTVILVTPGPPGRTLTIRPTNRTGIASISGPDANGTYTIIPLVDADYASFQTQLNAPGRITVEVSEPAPGGPATGIRA